MRNMNASAPMASPETPSVIVDLIPHHIRTILDFGMYVVLAGGISIFGLLANMTNIIVFIKQGLQESSTVSLLALSMSDFGVCITTIHCGICLALDILDVNILVVEMYGLYHVTGAWPKIYFAQLSMCTTMVLSLERCLCVVMPMTFKRIINRRNTVIFLGILYSEVTGCLIWVFSNEHLIWRFDELTNRTRLMRSFTASQLDAFHTFNNGILTMVCLLVVIVSTCVMTSGLKSSKKFRQKSSSTNTEAVSQISNKESRLVKLVVLISIIFVVCFLPMMGATLSLYLVPETTVLSKYTNLTSAMWAFVFLISSVNSAVNICVYYSFSSNYKRIFLTLIH